MDSVYWHLALSHVPILGVVFGTAVLAVALMKKSEDVKKAALALFVVSAATAIPVYLSGEGAEESVSGLPGVLASFMESHEETAAGAVLGTAILGVFSLGLLAYFRAPKKLPSRLLAVILLLALVDCGLLARTANLGGKIRHSEIRAGAVDAGGGKEDRD